MVGREELIEMSIIIEQGAWDRFEKPGYPEDITTGGMGPCTGVIVFNRDTGVTYGTHLPAPHTHEADVLAEMLGNAADEFSDSSSVDICISGCCENLPLPDYNPSEIRSYVEGEVREAFPHGANINVCWPEAGTTSISMTLDPETGNFYFD